MIGESSKRIAMEEGAEDRISSLPQDVIYNILDCMPIRDASRTITLSSKWRCFWAEYPNLVLDKQFAEGIRQNRVASHFQIDYVNIVNRILLHHLGAVPKFVLHFPEVASASLHSSIDKWKIYSNIDHWLLFLSRKGVRELTLGNSNCNHPYKVPSYLFSCPTLSCVTISMCILRAPTTQKGFTKLTSLILHEVIFESFVVVIPQLLVLSIRNCRGTRLLNISAPLLQSLTLYDNDDFELRSYMDCKILVYAYIALSNAVEHERQDDGIDLAAILGCWPMLSKLYLDGSTLKRLIAGTVPERLTARFKFLNYLILFRVSYDLDEIACILSLLRSSPSLSRLEIWARKIINSDMKVVDFLGEPGVMTGQRMNRLKTVMMKVYKGGAAELLFVKLLLASSPALERMCVEEDQKLASTKRLKTIKELIQLPRASSKAQVIFEPFAKPKGRRIHVA